MPSSIKQKLQIQGILLKVVLFGWLLILSTIFMFVLIGLPYQKQVLFDRMKSEASDVVSSVLNKNESALMTESFPDIVDYLLGLIEGSNSIQYIVATRSDGYSLIIKNKRWSVDTLAGYWLPDKTPDPAIIYSDLIESEIFHYTHKFKFSGIEWGWIHVGLSLESYNNAVSNINNRAIVLSVVLTFIGFIIAIFFARRLTKPITDLDAIVKRISDGDFSVTSDVKSGDELESLSNSFNKMTKSLKELRDKLELRVRERTAELAETNTALISEVQERVNAENRLSKYNLRLEALQEIYRGIISAKSTEEIIFETISNLKNKLISFSRSSVALYDFTKISMIVHSITYVNNRTLKKTETMDMSKIEPINKFNKVEYVYQRNVYDDTGHAEILDYIKPVEINSYVCYPLKFQEEYIGEFNVGSDKPEAFDSDTITIIKEIGSQLAIALAQSNLEDKLKLHAESLQSSLEEKEVLLKEIHHRVKNNLQIISSLLYLQSKRIKDKNILDIFLDSQNRVKSMALVHEKLYKSENLSSINFSEYIKNLSGYIANSYKSASTRIQMDYKLDLLLLPIDKAAPLGLMVNELLSNCFKYAFPKTFKPRSENNNLIVVELSVHADNHAELTIRDNGIGIPETLNLEECDTLGMQLIYSLGQQLESELQVSNSNGTSFSISFNY